MPTAEPQNNESKRARSMWPLPALGCLCLLALLGMFAAQQHREDGLRLLAAQQEAGFNLDMMPEVRIETATAYHCEYTNFYQGQRPAHWRREESNC